MNLISCNGCGIVFDKNKLKFPKDIYADDSSIDNKKAAWNDDEWVPFINCPVCCEKILESDY